MKKLNLIPTPKEPEKDLDILANYISATQQIDIKEEDIDMNFFDNIDNALLKSATNERIVIRGNMEFTRRAIYLSSSYNYAFGMDSVGLTILVPLKKK